MEAAAFVMWKDANNEQSAALLNLFHQCIYTIERGFQTEIVNVVAIKEGLILLRALNLGVQVS